jgi:hypothetical protein
MQKPCRVSIACSISRRREWPRGSSKLVVNLPELLERPQGFPLAAYLVTHRSLWARIFNRIPYEFLLETRDDKSVALLGPPSFIRRINNHFLLVRILEVECLVVRKRIKRLKGHIWPSDYTLVIARVERCVLG